MLVSIDQPAPRSDTGDAYDMLPDPLAAVEAEVIMRLGWEQIHKEFKADELDLLYHIVYQRKTQQELAEQNGVTQSTIAYRARIIKKRAKNILLGQNEV